jgi:hypothetical protein
MVESRAFEPFSDEETSHLWKSGFFRALLSHKAEFKNEARQLADALR